MTDPTPRLGLRMLTLVASGWAELTLQRSGILSMGALLGAWALLAAAGLGADRLRAAPGPALRRVVATAAMGLGLFLCVYGGGGAIAGDLGERLGLVVILAVAANALVQDSVRDLYVGLALTCATLVLAGGLAGGSSVAAPLVIGAMLVAVCLGRLGMARLSGGLAPVGGDSVAAGALATGVVAALVIGLLAFLLVPHPAGLHTQGRLASAVRAAVGAQDPSSSAGSGSLPRTPDGYVGRLDLRMRGNLPTEPVATVPWDAPDLWRGQVFSNYDGSGWSPPALSVTLVNPSTADTYPVPAEPGSVAVTTQRTDVVHLAQSGNVVPVLTPGQPVTVRSSVQPARTAEGSYVLPQAPADGSYEVTSQGYDVLRPRAGVRAGPDPGDVDRAEWTVLPAGVPSRVLALGGTLVGGSTDRIDAVHRVETYLRTHETYRLDAPVPAPGVDAVDAFLFGSHEGFCEQFASAETVLLRAGGIPARVVTGYAYGRPAGAGQRLFVGSDAHAWVEVYSPGVGWVASDPTAGAVLSKPHSTLASTVSSWLRRALDSTAGRAVLAVLLLVLVGAIAVVLRFAAGVVRRRRSAGAPLDARSRLLTALGRLEAALAADGRPREPGETLSELAARLRIDAVAASPAVAVSAVAAADALAVLARETYAPRGPTPPERVSAAAALETYAVAVEASAGRQKVP